MDELSMSVIANPSALWMLTSVASVLVASADESTQVSRSDGAGSPRPMLQILNGSKQLLEAYWWKSEDERVSNGRVEPGGETVITTTLGHRFAVVGQKDMFEVTVTSVVPVQALRFGPPDSDGAPAFYTQRVSANGFPIVASENVNPYALSEAAYLVNLMLAKRPDVRTAMIPSGARLCILAHNEYTTDQPEFERFGQRPPREFRRISGKDYWDARATQLLDSLFERRVRPLLHILEQGHLIVVSQLRLATTLIQLRLQGTFVTILLHQLADDALAHLVSFGHVLLSYSSGQVRLDNASP